MDIPIVAVENFLLEVGQDKWYDLGVIILEDVKQNINLQTFTQMTPVPSQIVETAQESTPEDYSKEGLAVTIGSLMGANLQVTLYFSLQCYEILLNRLSNFMPAVFTKLKTKKKKKDWRTTQLFIVKS